MSIQSTKGLAAWIVALALLVALPTALLALIDSGCDTVGVVTWHGVECFDNL